MGEMVMNGRLKLICIIGIIFQIFHAVSTRLRHFTIIQKVKLKRGEYGTWENIGFTEGA